MFEEIISQMHLFILFLISIVYFSIASYEDFKKKEVFNYINFSFVFIVLLWSLIVSFLFNDFNYLYISFIGSILGFFIGSLLFYLGTWGGGDAKFMIGFGAVFAQLSSYLHSFIIHSDTFSIILDVLLINTIEILIRASYTLVFLSIIVILILIALILIRKAYNHVLKDSALLILLLILQVISLVDFFSVYVRISSIILAIVVLFTLPQTSFMMLGKFKKISIKELEKLVSNQKIVFITKDIYHKDSLVLEFNSITSGISQDNIYKLKQYFSNNSTIEVVNPISIGLLIILNFFTAILLFMTSSLFSTSTIFVHLIEFILISFLVGGIYVISLVIFYIISNFNKTISQIPNYKKISYSIVLVLLSFLYLIVPQNVTLLILLFLLILLSLIFYDFTKIVEKYIFVSNVGIDSLSPGDWIVRDIVVNNRVLFKKEDFKLGVDENQIKTLKKYKKDLNHVVVKSGIAFIPHLFVSYIIIIVLTIL